MQHYRLPTRLLDWSESPLIASFFASEIYECHNKHPECIEDTDGALYALSPYKLNHSQLKTDCILMPEDTDSKAVMNPAFDVNAKEKKLVIAIRPSEVDVRLLVQLSVFTLNGFKIAIENLPPNDNYLIKFRIPKESKSQLRKNLKQLGIRLSSIFPDLDHLSEEIKELVFKPMKSNQTSQPVQQLYGNLRGKEPST